MQKERLALHRPVIEEIADLITELGISQESNDLTSDPSLVESLSARTFSRLVSIRDKLVLDKQQREQKIEELAAQITLLWEQLKVSQEARETFLSNNRGLGDAVIEAVFIIELELICSAKRNTTS